MRRFSFSFFAVLMVVAGLVSACRSNDPEMDPEAEKLRQALEKIDLFSRIEADPDTAVVSQKAQGELDYIAQFSMFFTQDLDHSEAGGESFQQRVCILFRGFDRPTVLVTEGYDWWAFRDAADIGINLNANMVHVEHRNYGQSYNSDQGHWQFQTVRQASADLHAVYQTLKPLFSGKWLSAGTSKNAETSIAYAYFYPEDMSVAVSFCGPFVIGLSDKRFGQYLFNETSTEENRELMRTGIRKALEGGEEGMYKTVCQRQAEENQWVPGFSEYVFDLFDTFFQVFQSTPYNEKKDELEGLAYDDETLIESICADVTENRDEEYYSYFVECTKEQGFPNNGYAYFSDLLDGTSFNPEEAAILLKDEDKWLISTYDSTVYANIVHDFFVNSTVPLLLFYAHDDPWTAGQPATIGPNVKKIINPIGIHSPFLNDPEFCPPAIRQEAMDFICTYIN